MAAANRGHAEVLDVIQFLAQTLEVARAVAVRVVKRADMDLVNDAAFIPERILAQAGAAAFYMRHNAIGKTRLKPHLATRFPRTCEK